MSLFIHAPNYSQGSTVGKTFLVLYSLLLSVLTRGRIWCVRDLIAKELRDMVIYPLFLWGENFFKGFRWCLMYYCVGGWGRWFWWQRGGKTIIQQFLHHCVDIVNMSYGLLLFWNRALMFDVLCRRLRKSILMAPRGKTINQLTVPQKAFISWLFACAQSFIFLKYLSKNHNLLSKKDKSLEEDWPGRPRRWKCWGIMGAQK